MTDNTHEEGSKKVVLPPFLIKRLEAFRIAKGDHRSYIIRDKLHGTTYDFEPWQFFVLEVLPGCETFEKLASVFKDKYDRDVTRREVDGLFGALADRKLLDEPLAAQHPLLVRFTKPTFTVEDGMPVQKIYSAPSSAPAAPEGDATWSAAPERASASAGAAASSGAAPAAGGSGAGGSSGTGAGASAAPAASATPNPSEGTGDPPLGLDWPDPKIKWFLGDPRPILRWLAPMLKPLWRVIYITPVLLVIAMYLALFRYFNLITFDFQRLVTDKISLVGHLIFAWLTVHALGSLSAAVVATNYKVSVEKVGFYPTFGFMPRWCLKMNGANLMTRKQMMWTHAAPLITRVVLLSVSIVWWFETRNTHNMMATFALMTMFTCMIGLTLEAGNPLLKAHAYYILCAYLNEPRLRAKAFVALWNRVRGNVYQAYDRDVLGVYALATLTWIAIVTLIIAHMLAKYLVNEEHLHGSAILIVLLFISWMVWLTWTGLRRFGEEFDRKLQFDRWRARALPIKDEVEGELTTPKRSYWRWALALGLLLLLFLPYHYEPNGPFLIFPVVKEDLTTDTPGVISEVFFNGGEFVKKGTVLARLAHDNYTAEYNKLTGQIEEQKHTIENLKTLPKPEAIALAEAQLHVAQSREPFSRQKAERRKPLYEAGAVTYEEYQNDVKEHEVDVEDVREKQANLALVKTGPTAEEIAAAEAQLQALQADRDGIQAKLDRTFIRMPFDGNILTLHLQDRLNSYLEPGKPFASVENTGYVTAQIQLQQSDLQFVKIGMDARLRPDSWFFDEFKGKVVQIDRDISDTKAEGTFVNAIVLIDNKDGRLHTGATGEAKIGPVTLPAWQAFTLSVERFFLVDVWSWLP